MTIDLPKELGKRSPFYIFFKQTRTVKDKKITLLYFGHKVPFYFQIFDNRMFPLIQL